MIDHKVCNYQVLSAAADYISICLLNIIANYTAIHVRVDLLQNVIAKHLHKYPGALANAMLQDI